MNIKEFINKFADVVEDDSVNALNHDDNFKELDSWDSLAALSIMAMIDEEYQVNLSANQFQSVTTFNDLFTLIKSEKAN